MRNGDPTPAEIRRQCLLIQQTWSEAERRKRAGWAYAAEEFRLPAADAQRFEADFCSPSAN